MESKSTRCVFTFLGVFTVVSQLVMQFSSSVTKDALQMISVTMTYAAVLAIIAYNCFFEESMAEQPVFYMMQLLYFRSSKCDRFIHWDRLGIHNVTYLQPELPDEASAVTRTLIFAGFYIVFHLILMGAALNMLRKFSFHFNCTL